MSLYGMMRTGVSGMAAQANRLSTVADNIANSGTTGYKRSRAEFASMVLPTVTGAYNSGGVTTAVQTAISSQGVLQYTTSVTDLAVNGNGFFVVQDPSGQPFLTRAGAFVPDGDGRLVNAAGFQLMGYRLASGTGLTANGFGGLEAISLSDDTMVATPTTTARFTANLPVLAEAATGNLPSANTAPASFTAKSSLVVYDNVGSEVSLDIYFTKTGTNSWEATVYDGRTAAEGGGFPYAAALGTTTLSFDPTSGKLAAGSATSLAIDVPGGRPVTLDLSGQTELAGGYNVREAKRDGNAPSSVEQIQIDGDGTVYAQYQNGTLRSLYRIPLATAVSPDMLTVVNGNVYAQSPQSGSIRIGFPEEGEFGSVVSGALENSTVDIAEELTNMIESQRSYTANSKVFQTGSDLMDILVNLKR